MSDIGQFVKDLIDLINVLNREPEAERSVKSLIEFLQPEPKTINYKQETATALPSQPR